MQYYKDVAGQEMTATGYDYSLHRNEGHKDDVDDAGFDIKVS